MTLSGGDRWMVVFEKPPNFAERRQIIDLCFRQVT
jgi:hypothetical protein